MATIEIIQAPVSMGPLTLNITRNEAGRAVSASVSIAGRKWTLAKLEPNEREWVHRKLDELGIARREALK